LMRVPDELTGKYLALLTDAPEEPSLGPAEAKRAMARAVVDGLYGEGAGKKAEIAFDRVHRDRELPADIEELPILDDVVKDGRVGTLTCCATLPIEASALFGVAARTLRTEQCVKSQCVPRRTGERGSPCSTGLTDRTKVRPDCKSRPDRNG